MKMETRSYLTVTAIVGILYALGFLLIPELVAQIFGNVTEPHAIMNIRFCGAAVLAWGLILWFARDWDRTAVRGAIIGTVVGQAIIIIINVWGTIAGLLNVNAWGSTIIIGALLLWGLYHLYYLSSHVSKTA
jgi:hypothetical protein